MLRILIVFILSFLFLRSWGQEANFPEKSIESLIADQAIPLPDNCSFSFLDSIVRGKRIVILGEAEHMDGTTFETKANMIKYLYEKHHFNILVAEAFPIEVRNWSVPYFFVSKYCQPWANEMLEGRSMDYMGMECSYGGYGVCADVLRKNGRSQEATEIIRQFNTLFRSNLFNHETWALTTPVSSASVIKFTQLVGQAKGYLLRILEQSSDSGEVRDAIFYMDNMKKKLHEDLIMSRHAAINTPSDQLDLQVIREWNIVRDRNMADNLIYYLKHHPDDKLVVWCASFHGAKDLSQVVYPRDSTFYPMTRSMGEHLYNEFGDELYSIAFTSYYDEPDRRGILEDELGEREMEWGFINFESLRLQDEFLNKTFNCNAIQKKDGRWMYVWDGLYFIRHQQPDERIDNWEKMNEDYDKLPEKKEK